MPPVYVVVDEAGVRVVCLDPPAEPQPPRRTEHDGIVELRTPRFHDRPLEESAGCAGGVVMAAGLVALVVHFEWWLLPLPFLGVLLQAVGARARRRRRQLWPQRRIVLDRPDDVALFDRAFGAATAVVGAWRTLGHLTQLPAGAGEQLAESLWQLAGQLRQRGALQERRDELDGARGALPAAADVYPELVTKLEDVSAALETLEHDVQSRVTALESLARECDGFVRHETAVADARDAIRRADESLNSGVVRTADESAELADRTRAVIAAYLELTSHNS